jgi:hypothetical protein
VFSLVLALGMAWQAGTRPPEPLRVLFIGNSYTYFHNVPEQFAALARAAQPGREVSWPAYSCSPCCRTPGSPTFP